jgi:site-specific DNA-adenine methylase
VSKVTKKKKPISNWLGYSGNKSKQIETLMALIPKKTETFVDLFGGTGIVGCNAYHFNRCKKVVYNDLEYDLMLTLRQLHDFSGEEIRSISERFYRRMNGSQPNKEGLIPDQEFKETYLRIRDDYNRERAIAWDSDRAQQDLAEYLKRAKKVKNNQVTLDYYGGDFDVRIPASKIKNEFNYGVDIQNPFEFLFLAKHSFLQTPHLKDNGRKFKETPRLGGGKNGAVNIRRGEEAVIEFFNAWHKTPVEFFSVSFTEGWLSTAQHERPREAHMRERWARLLESLTPRDFVFIDPPYHGSNAGYNAKWKLSMEIYLMAFCQQLDARKIPFLITNNLGWNRTLFIEWTRLPHMHTYMWSEEAALKLYSGKDDKSKNEVYVSNKCFPAAKYALPDGLIEVVLKERTADEMPAEIRYIKHDRGLTYKQRQLEARNAENWRPERELKNE